MSDSQFRGWMEDLLSSNRLCSDWPQQFVWLLDATLRREQDICRRYTGESVVIDRQLHPTTDNPGEKRAVYGLYHRCHEKGHNGSLSIDGEAYWLISYEVPNQFAESGRRADLLGLSMTGGLCVFECKIGRNSYSPMAALLEGLDYLACLTCESNFSRIEREFATLPQIQHPPTGFKGVHPQRGARHEVIVLADPEYYLFHTRRPLSQGWRMLTQLRHCDSAVSLAFAEATLDEAGLFSHDRIHWCLD